MDYKLSTVVCLHLDDDLSEGASQKDATFRPIKCQSSRNTGSGKAFEVYLDTVVSPTTLFPPLTLGGHVVATM